MPPRKRPLSKPTRNIFAGRQVTPPSSAKPPFKPKGEKPCRCGACGPKVATTRVVVGGAMFIVQGG
jgi:hypothetical protein